MGGAGPPGRRGSGGGLAPLRLVARGGGVVGTLRKHQSAQGCPQAMAVLGSLWRDVWVGRVGQD